MTYLHTKFHMYSPNGSLVIATKLKAREKFCMATLSLI
jgi:hypothetical protein